MQDQNEVDARVLDAWFHCRAPNYGESLGKQMCWLDHTPGGSYYWTLSGNIWFELEEDRAFFLLTWG
jgi:hypothetical protein